MIKMATGDDSLLRQGVGTGFWLVFGGYRGLRQRNSGLGFFSGVSVFIGIFGVGLTSGGSPSHPRGRGPRPGGRPRPPPSWMARDCSGPTILLWGLLLDHKKHKKLARQLDFVCYSFSVKLKNKEKTETGTGL